MNINKLIAALAAGIAAAQLTREQQQIISDTVSDIVDEQHDDYDDFSELNTYIPPLSAKPYLSKLNAAEDKYGLPKNLLTRVAQQESNFRDDIITGKTVSSAGAVGIMQIVPRWHPDVDPLNVGEAIDYAANYLKILYDEFGDWRMALAAYNWGWGNLKRNGFERAPAETVNYVKEISNDVLRSYA